MPALHLKKHEISSALFLCCLPGLKLVQLYLQKAIGLKSPGVLSEKALIKYAHKYNILLADSYLPDSAYGSCILSFDTLHCKEQQKNHYQPLQALYYAGNGKLESFHINCYAGGFPNLQWNRYGIMQVFPPRQQAPANSLLSLDAFLKFIKPLPTSSSFSVNNYDYIVIVCWSRFMGRQSKILIEHVQHNVTPAAGKKVKVIYVNNDQLFGDSEIE